MNESAVVRRSKTYALAMTAVMAAVTCVLAPVALPIGPIPITLCTLVIYLTAYLLPWRWATAATVVYILLGAVGMPVFTGFTGGVGKMLGPTGGYIVGYIPLALICALSVRLFPKKRVLQVVGMLLGTAVLYALGTAWYCVQAQAALGAAVAACVFPFIPGDLLKIAVAVAAGPVLHARLVSAGLMD